MKVFIIEDNELYRTLVEHHLKTKTNFSITAFDCGEAVLEHLKTADKPDVIVSDYYLDGKIADARELLQKIHLLDPNIPVLILTGQKDMQTALDILKEGAFDFIVKDENAMEKIVSSLNRFSELSSLKGQMRSQQSKSKKDIKRMLILFVFITLFFLYLFIKN